MPSRYKDLAVNTTIPGPALRATTDNSQPAFTNTLPPSDAALLAATTVAVQAAGHVLKTRFSMRPPVFENLADVVRAIHANDAAALAVLRGPLMAARPGAQWAEDELASGALPPGEWWVTDPVEGNINHIHGLAEWCVTATLVRDNLPTLTVVHLPLTGDTYAAVRGHGAWCNGVRLSGSAKTELAAALVATGQAAPGEGSDTHRRIGESATAMLQAALVLRVAVPATWQLMHLAAGSIDVFWQFSQVRSGLVAGALLVHEAGGTLSDTHGRPWTLASADFLAAAPGLHAAAVDVLRTIG